jgi:hypothetical protein
MQLAKEVAKKVKQERLAREATSKVTRNIFNYFYKIKKK